MELKIMKSSFNKEAFLNLKTSQEKIEYLRGADLRYANLSCLDLSYLDLGGLNFIGAKLSYAKLSYAYLSYADLSYMDLRCADFIGADLRYADLSGADLRHAYLSDANLSDANLSGADLNYADLRGADLRHADLPKHKNVTISGYRILIFAFHIQVGCHVFAHEEFLEEKSEDLTKWNDSDKRLFRKHKEEIKNLLQEFLKNNQGE